MFIVCAFRSLFSFIIGILLYFLYYLVFLCFISILIFINRLFAFNKRIDITYYMIYNKRKILIRMKYMTNREIAKELNISPATLSLILNNKPGVSDQTRASVLEKVVAMGYGHLIKTEKKAYDTQTICFVVYIKHGKILNQHPFFLLLMESIESHARKFGYQILLVTMDSKSPIKERLKSLESINPKGIILFATEMSDEDIRLFTSLSIPYVAIDNDFPRLDVNTVSINNQLGTFQAIDYLVQQGHRNIGYLQSIDSISSFEERRQGYLDALKYFQLSLKSENIHQVRYTEEGSFQDIARLLEQHIQLPTAFVCDDDTIAVGAIRAFRLAGIRVPDDISLIGFNDRPNSAITIPPLTSINVPKASFGSNAVNSIISLIEKREQNSFDRSIKTRIATQLVIRGSVAKIRTTFK